MGVKTLLEKATTVELKKMNKRKIFELIYQEKTIAKQDIAMKLGMSLPTISQNLKELESMNLIEKNGLFQSTGGRKAQAISCVSNTKLAIVIEVSKNNIQIVAIDLYGSIIREFSQNLAYNNIDNYYQTLGTLVTQFIQSLHLSVKRILGIGIALQGLISSDGKTVTYGKILGCTGISIDNFTKYISYPCSMIHDAEAAATAELWCTSEITDAIYFHMGSNLGGAVIIDGKLHKGRELKSGVIEHMTIVPNGKPCYCGKKGCLETYCSIVSLLEVGEQLEDFFKKLRSGSKEHLTRWQDYLGYLALAIDNLHMIIDCEIILGGYLSAYITAEDVKEIQALVEKDTAFPIEYSFIKTGRCNTSAIAQGAALPYITQFLATIIE
jgi:predicted NBD/HSP70 family sugar kinase